jgi:hypothetical protein
LQGIIEKPKVAIYHKRLQLPGLQKSLPVAAFMVEENAVVALAAAERLQPCELKALPEEELRPALALVLKAIPASELPREMVLGLVRRRALLVLDQPATLMKVCWPWPGSSASEFDPYEPTMATTPQWHDYSSEDKVRLAADILVQEALATYMVRKEAGVKLVVQLSQVVQAAPVGLADSQAGTVTDAGATVVRDLRGTLAAIAAIVQTTPATSDQLKGLAALRDGFPPGSCGEGLAQLLADPWWADRLNKVWHTAAAESLAAPAMARITLQLASDTEAGQAWSTAQGKLAKWQKDLRMGATAELVAAMASHCRAQVAQAKQASVHDEDWLATAEAVRSRICWLQGFVPGTLARELASLMTEMQEASARSKLRAGMALLDNVIEGLASDRDVADMAEAFGNCRGLRADSADAARMMQAMEHLRNSDRMSAEKADLALAMIAILPDTGGSAASPATPPVAQLAKDWRKTSIGFQLAEVQMSLGAAAKGDPVDQAKVKDILSAWAANDGTPIGNEAGAAAAQESLEEWLANSFETSAKQVIAQATKAAAALEVRAGGKMGGGSWKEQLSEDSSWEDVEREANYHLFPSGRSISAELDRAFEQAAKALADLVNLEAYGDSALETRLKTAMLDARVTGTEAPLLKVR